METKVEKEHPMSYPRSTGVGPCVYGHTRQRYETSMGKLLYQPGGFARKSVLFRKL